MQAQQSPLQKETEQTQQKETTVGEQVDQTHLPAQQTTQDQDKYRGGQQKHQERVRKINLVKIIFKMTQPSSPSGSTGETTLDPTSISDQHLFNLHQVISKESTKRWKKVIKEGSSGFKNKGGSKENATGMQREGHKAFRNRAAARNGEPLGGF
jgi:hypothetical protein